MAERAGYFPESAAESRTPGELHLVRVILVGSGIVALLIILWGVVVSRETAQMIGAAVGANVPTFVGIVLALLIRRGRRWVRWAVTGVGAVWSVAGIMIVVEGGPAYLSRMLLPIVLVIAVHLPDARRYFAGD